MNAGWTPNAGPMNSVGGQGDRQPQDPPEVPLASVSRLSPPSGSQGVRALRESASVRPRRAPPWWRQPWFWALITLPAVLAGFMFFR